MTTVYEIPLQHWIGSIDVNGMLGCVGSWHVGSYTAMRHAPGIHYATEQGWITTRLHYIPSTNETVQAYELTDAGIERFRQSYGPRAAERAKASRQWYRDRWKAYNPSAATEQAEPSRSEPTPSKA